MKTKSKSSNGAISVPYSKFKAEVDLKNQAFYFILQQGLLKKYAKFCNSMNLNDWDTVRNHSSTFKTA